MPKEFEKFDLDAGFPSSSRHLSAHRYGNRGSRPKIYIQAGLHAEEIPGMLALCHLLQLLDGAESRGEIIGEIVVVPFVNPVGAENWINGVLVGRNDLGGEGNFNRHWPSIGRQVAEEARNLLDDDEACNLSVLRQIIGRHADRLPEASEVQKIKKTVFQLAFDSDIAIDIHCDREAVVHAYTYKSCWPALSDLCAQTGCEAVLLETGLDSAGTSTDLLTGTWDVIRAELGDDFPIPIGCQSVTLELRGQGDVDHELAWSDASSLLKFLQRRRAVAGDPGPLPEPLCSAQTLAATDLLIAPRGGIVAFKAPLGTSVARGAVVAEIIDPSARDPMGSAVEIRSQTEGVVVSRLLIRFVPRGEVVAKVVGATPIRSGPLLER